MPGVPATVERCGSPNDLLHEIVRVGLPRLLSSLSEQGRTLPTHVVSELERFIRCGDPEEGFAWLVCEGCAHHRLVPLSCKGRAVCPSCGGRRMASSAARWCEELVPRVAVRQWVITVPWSRRLLLARRPELLVGVRRIAMAEVFGFYEAQVAHRDEAARCGGVVVVQRFGSALNLNVHLHALVPDGVFEEGEDGLVRFRRGRAPTTEEVEAVVERVARRAEAWLSSQGFGVEDEVPVEDDPDDAGVLLQALSLEGRVAVGERAGRRDERSRVQVLSGREVPLPRQCGQHEGYTVHAGVVIGAQNREGLERLCRYVLRPPLAKSRLERRWDGGLDLHFKRAWADGTTGIVLSDAELVAKLAALVPPPRKHLVSYHGVFANRSSWRSRVVPQKRARTKAPRLVRAVVASQVSTWEPWAALLERVFGVNGFACPRCDGQMQLRGVVIGRPATTKVLAGLRMAARGPPGVAVGA